MDYRKIRRVVTGTDADGKSVITHDDLIHALYSHPSTPGRGMADVWQGVGLPAVIREGDDLTEKEPVQLLPPDGGFVARFVQIPPESEAAGDAVHRDYFEGMGAGPDIRPEKSRHPAMHRTPTLDICFVMSGEIWALMDDSEVLLKAGDVLVQRATLHGWRNRSDQPCMLAGILLSARVE